jgi:hypothetical protein
MQHEDLSSLTGRLLWGTPTTRQQVADQLLRQHPGPGLELLAETVRSRESWRLRGRCLEVLGLVAGEADQLLVERVLRLLLEGSIDRARVDVRAIETHHDG